MTTLHPVPTRHLLTHRGFWWWALGGQLVRLPVAMAPLAFTALTAAWYGSYAVGAAMVAALVLADVAAAVPAGRLMDRVGVVRTAQALLCVRASALAALPVVALARAPGWALVTLAAAAGAAGGGILGGFRTLLTGVVGNRLLNRAVAAQGVLTDLVVVTGPLLVAALLTAGAVAPLVVMVAASLLAGGCAARVGARTGAPAGAGSPPAGSGSPPDRRLLRPLAGWLLCAFVAGYLASTVEVAALPVAAGHGGGAAAAALLVGALCAAGMASGLAYTVGDWRGGGRAAGALVGVMAGGAAVVAAAPWWPVVLAGAVAVGAGLPPLLAICSVRAERVLPGDRRAEGFALLSTVQGLGFGAGSLSVALLT